MSACLEPNAVVDLVAGTASELAILDAERHMDGCADCRELVAATARREPRPEVTSEVDWQATSGAEVVGGGARIGRYTVLEPIGSGATSIVYAAYDAKLDRRIALKLLRVFGAGGDALAAARARLIREAQALARVTHPNVVAVHDASGRGDQVFVAMEYIRGQSLATWRTGAARPWPVVVKVLLAAARGLAAAHRAGVVHRDFKPANVMLGDDGQIKVTDFGLAQIGAAPPIESPAPGAADPSITQTGAVLGTPAYMAPEVSAGGPATAHSDQYSFAVTLFETLAGVRPDQDRGALAASGAPRWLQRIVDRGLAADPAARFSSMDAVARALDHRPRWPVIAVAAAGAIALGAAAIAWTGRDAGAVRCDGDPDRWATVWSPARAAKVATGFLADTRPHVAATYGRLAAAIGQRGHDWTTTRIAVCEATHRRGTQSPALLDVRIACLDQQLREVDAAVGVLTGDLDRSVVDRALQLFERLPDARDCAAVTAGAETPAPAEPGPRRRLTALRERLARGFALLEADKFEGARSEALAAVGEARELGRAGELAAALHLEAGTAAALGDDERAEKASIEAAASAAQAGDIDRLARLHILLARVVGVHQRRADEGVVWALAAEADLANLAGAGSAARLDLEADRLRELGDIKLHQGDFAGGIEILERAVAAAREAHGPDHLDVADHLDRIGAAERNRGDYEAARARIGESIAILERTVTPDHPALAQPLANLGTIVRTLGDFDEAARLGERALALLENGYGREHPHVATALDMLGMTRMRQGRYDDARAAHRRAMAINEKNGNPPLERARSIGYLANIDVSEGKYEAAIAGYREALAGQLAALGPDHPVIASLRFNLGESLHGAGRDREAMVELERALSIWQARLGKDSDTAVQPVEAMAEIDRGRGRCTEALPAYARVIEVREAKFGKQHPLLIPPLSGRGICLVELARHREAIAALDRAIALRLELESDEPSGLALVRYHLSRALVGAGDDAARARQLADQALEGLAGIERGEAVEGVGRVLRPDEARQLLAQARRWRRQLR